MKLLYLANQRFPTEKAYGIQISKMCEAFALSGLDVTLLIPKRKKSSAKAVFEYYGLKRNFKVFQVFSVDFYLPGKLDRFAFWIKNFISAIILCIYVLRSSAELIYSRDELPLYLLSFFKKNLIFEAHKFSPQRLGFYRRFKYVDFKIVTVSKGIKNEFVKFGFKPEKILVAHDGVDLDQFNIPLSQEECRDRVGIPRDRKIVGYVGQLSTMGMEKGIGNLVEAVGELHPSHPELVLAIVGGSNEDIRTYQTFGKEKGLDDTILFFGHKEHKEIPFYLKAFDILTMPFPNKPHYALYMSPLKLFEYMASGRPIVASDLPSIREVLNEHNALLIPSDEPRALATGIQQSINDPELASRLARQAYIDVQRYTWQRRADIILSFIKQR